MAVALGNVNLTEHVCSRVRERRGATVSRGASCQQRGFATLAFFVKRRVTKMRMGHEERTHKILDRQQARSAPLVVRIAEPSSISLSAGVAAPRGAPASFYCPAGTSLAGSSSVHFVLRHFLRNHECHL
jgi:hypothetical protein